MSAQFTTHSAVHSGSWMMVEKTIVLETHVQLRIHSNSRVALQRTTFFKYFLKALSFGYYEWIGVTNQQAEMINST